MELWLLRNVGFYLSFLQFYVFSMVDWIVIQLNIINI